MALRALRRNKMRSVLTMLGIIIGVGAVIAMVAIGNGATSQVEGQIASLGQNVVLVFSGSFTNGGVRSGWGSAGTLKIEDAEAIKREIPDVVAVSPEVPHQRPGRRGNQNWFTNLLGESPDYFDIRQLAVLARAPASPIRMCAAPPRWRHRPDHREAALSATTIPGPDPARQKRPVQIVGVLAPKGSPSWGRTRTTS
jgi:hypothetical protein